MRRASIGASGRGQATSAARRASRSARSGSCGERVEVGVRRGVDLGARGGDHRLVEVREAHLAREVGDDRVAALGRRGEPVEHLAEVGPATPGERVGRSSRRSRIASTAPRTAPARCWAEEQAVAGLLQRRRAVEALDAVVAQRPAQQLGVAPSGGPRPPRRASAGRRAGAPAGCAPARPRRRRRPGAGWASARRSANSASRRCSPGTSPGSQASRSEHSPCRSPTIRSTSAASTS